MSEKQKLKKVIYQWGEQVRVGQGRLLFVTEEYRLLPLHESEVEHFEVVGEVDYDIAYGIKKGAAGFMAGFN